MEFERVKLCRNRLEIELPCGFVDMPDYLAKRKFPSKFRPPVILMSKDTMVTYSFHLMDVLLSDAELMEATKGFYLNMKKNTASGRFDEIQIIEREGGKVAAFSYEAAAMDADIFGVIYVTGIEGKLLYGAFNCIQPEREKWEGIAYYSVSSIREVNKDED